MQSLRQSSQDEQYYQRAQEYFRPLRPLLEEMVSTLKSQFIKSNLYDDHATLEVGSEEDKTQWIIRPCCKKGYGVEKNQYFYTEQDSDLFFFDNETDTMEYIVKEVVEKVVHSCYWERGGKTAYASEDTSG